MPGYVWLPITSSKVMNIPMSLPLVQLNEQIKRHHLRDSFLLVTFDLSSSLAWILPLDNIFCACAVSRGLHPAETHGHTQIKIQPMNIQLTAFHHSFQTCLSLIFSLTHTGRDSRSVEVWRDVDEWMWRVSSWTNRAWAHMLLHPEKYAYYTNRWGK